MSRNSETEVEAILAKIIGARIKVARTDRGVSQSQIGAILGVAFQQIGKFERGENRITAAQLYILAQFLGVELSYFFENVPNINFKPTLESQSLN